MATACLAQTRDTCVVVTADDTGETSIQRSVGAGGANLPADVRTIQDALNGVAPRNGGPSPPLKVDGICGRNTLAAIKRFQQTHVAIVDSRIDPDGPTLAALNGELDRNPPAVVAVAPTTGAAAAPRKRKPEFLPPDPEIIARVVFLLSRVRSTILAANFRLSTADSFVTDQKLTIPTGPFLAGVRQSLELLDGVFGLGKLRNPRPAFENIKRIYRNMDVALNRSFETAPPVASILFVPNTHISMEAKAAAYTSEGGAFLPDKEKFAGLPEPANRIYVCRNFLQETVIQQVSALVHELAHYVSGQPIKVGDVVKKGRMLNAADRPNFDKIRPEQKVASAEHYSFFAIVAEFPRFLKT